MTRASCQKLAGPFGAIARQEQHPVFPRVRAQRPAVAEYNRLAGAPVHVKNARAVLGRDRAHCVNPSRVDGCEWRQGPLIVENRLDRLALADNLVLGNDRHLPTIAKLRSRRGGSAI